jgi:hypothetical protein
MAFCNNNSPPQRGQRGISLSGCMAWHAFFLPMQDAMEAFLIGKKSPALAGYYDRNGRFVSRSTLTRVRGRRSRSALFETFFW